MRETLSYLPQILPAYIAYIIAVISPGPAIMAIVSTSMTQGRKAGMTIALGIFGGSFTWACAAALGLATILQTYAIALEILKVFGGSICYTSPTKLSRRCAPARIFHGRRTKGSSRPKP